MTLIGLSVSGMSALFWGIALYSNVCLGHISGNKFMAVFPGYFMSLIFVIHAIGLKPSSGVMLEGPL